jgi:phosphatidylglycerol:prolipoprotein diacylglycerol transferase
VHPYLLHSGHLYLPTFGALAALGLMLSLTLSLKTAETVGLSPDSVWNAGMFAVLAAFILSRMLLVATNLRSFMQYPLLLLAVPSLTAMGLLLTGIATGVWLWMHRLPLLTTLDAWAPCATMTWAFLALGHFAEGSDLGMPTDSRLGFALPGFTTRQIPVAVYAATVAVILTVLMVKHLRMRQHAGDTLAVTLGLAGLAQFLLCFWREPSFDATFGALLDPLEWVALGMIVCSVIVWLQRRPLASVSGKDFLQV